MYTVCLKYSTSREAARDLLHDVFIEIFASIGSYRGSGSLEGWMKRIAINKAIDAYRSIREYPQEDPGRHLAEDVTLDAAELPPTLDELLSMIQGLPDRYRLVFSLYQLDGYSHQQIAGLMGISEGTSKSNLHRAKILLKRQILDRNRGTSPQKGRS